MHKHQTKKGFTLVETLVAISILMVAIAGPLTVANKAYTSAIDARNQSIASNLAQEGLESVNYIKDNNSWLDSASWDRNSMPATYPGIFASCIISSPCTDATVTGLGSLNFHPGFTRTYAFDYKHLNNFLLDRSQVSVVVTVSWSTGLINNSVVLQQVLTNYER